MYLDSLKYIFFVLFILMDVCRQFFVSSAWLNPSGIDIGSRARGHPFCNQDKLALFDLPLLLH